MKQQQKYSPPFASPFIKYPFITVNGVSVLEGEEIKIRRVHGAKFRFVAHVINGATGAEWIDCYELDGGRAMSARSFPVSDIIPIKKKANGKRTRVSTGPS